MQVQMNDRDSVHPIGQSQTQARTRARAKAKITVQNSEAKPYDQTASPALVEVRLTETFTGDIEGESPVRALQVLRALSAVRGLYRQNSHSAIRWVREVRAA